MTSTKSVPDFMNEDFFKTALENTLSEKINIKNLDVEHNTSCGNYCSNIYRAAVKYATDNSPEDTKEINLLVKDLFEHMSGSSREHFMYTTLLPALNAILQKTQPDKQLSPRLFHAKKDNNETHVFEDLNARGYVICNRLVGYNEEETKVVLTKLAQLHASSMVFMKEQPKVIAELKEFYFKSEPGIMELLTKLTQDYANYSSKIVEKWPGYAKIAEKMRKNIGDTFKQKMLNIFPKEQAKVKVLVHADLWIKNILMLRDIEGPKDAIFVDYQMCFEGSPAMDIHNLLMTSVKLDVLKTKRFELIKHYYEALRTALIECNYNKDDIPTLDDILSEVERTEFFSYYELIFPFAQTNLSDKLSEGLGVGDLTEENNMERTLKDIYSNRRVLDTYAYELRRLDDLGILD